MDVPPSHMPTEIKRPLMTTEIMKWSLSGWPFQFLLIRIIYDNYVGIDLSKIFKLFEFRFLHVRSFCFLISYQPWHFVKQSVESFGKSNVWMEFTNISHNDQTLNVILESGKRKNISGSSRLKKPLKKKLTKFLMQF